MIHVYGLPHFGVSNVFKTRPYGQDERFAPYPLPKSRYNLVPGRSYTAPTKDPEFMKSLRVTVREAAGEWAAIYCLLATAGLTPRVMLAFRDLLGPQYFDSMIDGPFPTINFPDIDILVQGFPRDLWTMLPNGTVMMDLSWHRFQAMLNPHCHVVEPAWTEKHGIVDSIYGEGGRILVRRSLAIVFDKAEMPGLETLNALGEDRYELKPPPIWQLTDQALEVLELPEVSATFLDDQSHEMGFGADNHIDRFFSLIEDRQGALHLLADPLIWSGFQGQRKPPKYNPDSTLRECRRRAIRAGIEFHRIKQIHHPLAMGIYQTADGRVVMSGGEPELREVIADLVGDDQVITSEEPLYRYGAWFYAGIRCLVNEAPDYFVDDPPRVMKPKGYLANA